MITELLRSVVNFCNNRNDSYWLLDEVRSLKCRLEVFVFDDIVYQYIVQHLQTLNLRVLSATVL